MIESEAITPNAAKVEEALQEWITGQIKESTTHTFELGKFLFGVSSGTIGVFVTVSEFSKNSWAGQEWAALAFFVLSGAIALLMAMPQIYRLSDIRDLAEAHSRFVTDVKNRSIVWGMCWVIALLFASVGLSDKGG